MPISTVNKQLILFTIVLPKDFYDIIQGKYGKARDYSLLQNINGKIMRLNPPKNELCTCCRTIYDASRSIVSERALTLNGY